MSSVFHTHITRSTSPRTESAACLSTDANSGISPARRDVSGNSSTINVNVAGNVRIVFSRRKGDLICVFIFGVRYRSVVVLTFIYAIAVPITKTLFSAHVKRLAAEVRRILVDNIGQVRKFGQ